MDLRELRADDILQVLDVQKDAYREELLESGDTFLRILTVFPRGCLGVFVGSQLVSYVFSHPWRSDRIVPLDDPRAALPDDADCLYIHDMAVRKSYHGKGVGTCLVKALLHLAKTLGYRQLGLVAVQESETFWERWGFKRDEPLVYTANVPATHMVLDCEIP
jgi:GNAT superfamily N-acetyltransferase